jgi:hypothetical protein
MIKAAFQFLMNGQLDGKPFEKKFKNEQEKVTWLRYTQNELATPRIDHSVRGIVQVRDRVLCSHCLGEGFV